MPPPPRPDGTASALVPLTLVSGPEELLASRAVAQVAAAARARDPATDMRMLAPDQVTVGELTELTGPSLFGDLRVVVLLASQDLADDLRTAVQAYATAPEPDVCLVVVHNGGVKGRKTAEALTKAGARVVACPAVKRPGERVDFVLAELRRGGVRAPAPVARVVVDAVGSDLRELAAACEQLAADTVGGLGEDEVRRFFAGRAEVTGFQVAERVLHGDAAGAVTLLRQALLSGVAPVLVASALAGQVRSVLRVGSAGGGRSADLARDLEMAPWQVDRAREQLRGWSPVGLSRALVGLAGTDAAVKGAVVDPGYALERAVLDVVALRGVA